MNNTGKILWRDLTVANADEVSAFYESVVGWKRVASDNDGGDFYIYPNQDSNDSHAGICYAKGSNANLPPQWLMYVIVANVEESVQKCILLGGKVIDGPRKMGEKVFCCIQDPAGAYIALMEE